MAKVDACQYGMTGSLHGCDHPVKKPTRWMSSIREVNEALSKTCSGTGGACSDGTPHASCTGRSAEATAVYPLQLCRAILRGIRSHLKSVGRMDDDTVGMMPETGEDMMNVDLMELPCSGYELGEQQTEARDDEVQGQLLVAKAAAHRGAVDRRNAQRYGDRKSVV